MNMWQENAITNNNFVDFDVLIVDLRTEGHSQSAQAVHVEEQGTGVWSFYF